MGRKFKDMQTPEQQYAAGRAKELHCQAAALEQSAARMTETIQQTAYGNPGRRQQAVSEAQDTSRRAQRTHEEAARVESEAAKPAKKRRWL